MNWAFQPLMYAAIYLFDPFSFFSSGEKRRRRCLPSSQEPSAWPRMVSSEYANVAGMAADMTAQSWVDPERFPLLRRRMYWTLENPNLLGAYAVMIISILTAFFLRERQKKRNGLLPSFSLSCFFRLALTYSRGAWLSLAAIVLGLTLFYDKRFGFLLSLSFFSSPRPDGRAFCPSSPAKTPLSARPPGGHCHDQEHPLLWRGVGEAMIWPIPTTTSSFRMSTSSSSMRTTCISICSPKSAS